MRGLKNESVNRDTGALYEDDKWTPEQTLWCAVLYTFLEDVAAAVRFESEWKIRALMEMIETPWCVFCCEMAGVNYTAFLRGVIELAKGKRKWKRLRARAPIQNDENDEFNGASRDSFDFDDWWF